MNQDNSTSKAPEVLRPDHPQGVQKGYDRWAEVYDRDGNPLLALEEPRVRQLAGDVRGMTVLDLGCGTGRHALWLAAAGANVTAMDFSRGMLDEAKQKPGASTIRFVEHDLRQRLPFNDATFDLIVSGLVIEHIPELAHYFGETRRVLRPNGSAIITSMHPAMLLRGTQARFVDPATGEVVMPGSYPHQLSDMVMSAVRAGFHLVEFTEHLADADLGAKFPRAQKYFGWPMLMVMKLN